MGCITFGQSGRYRCYDADSQGEQCRQHVPQGFLLLSSRIDRVVASACLAAAADGDSCGLASAPDGRILLLEPFPHDASHIVGWCGAQPTQPSKKWHPQHVLAAAPDEEEEE